MWFWFFFLWKTIHYGHNLNTRNAKKVKFPQIAHRKIQCVSAFLSQKSMRFILWNKIKGLDFGLISTYNFELSNNNLVCFYTKNDEKIYLLKSSLENVPINILSNLVKNIGHFLPFCSITKCFFRPQITKKCQYLFKLRLLYVARFWIFCPII